MSERKCRLCGSLKAESEFYTHTKGKNLRSECKTCTQDAALQQKLGITLLNYEEMLNAQDRRCKICSLHISEYLYKGTNQRFHVDHNHKTGRIRGLLCAGCNTAIGLLKDDPRLLQKASEYLVVDDIV